MKRREAVRRIAYVAAARSGALRNSGSPRDARVHHHPAHSAGADHSGGAEPRVRRAADRHGAGAAGRADLRRHAADLWRLNRSSRSPVSIVAPAFNEELTITESVRASLLSVNYPNLEVIVVNDGSKDDTIGTLIREFNLVPAHPPVVAKLAHQPIKRIYTRSTTRRWSSWTRSMGARPTRPMPASRLRAIRWSA
jgi:hypothetical protein